MERINTDSYKVQSLTPGTVGDFWLRFHIYSLLTSPTVAFKTSEGLLNLIGYVY